MMGTTDLYLRFPTMDEALAVAEAIVLADDPGRTMIDPNTGETVPLKVTRLPPDGRLATNLYDIAVVPGPSTGVYVLGRWRGDDPVPDALTAYAVEPWGSILG